MRKGRQQIIVFRDPPNQPIFVVIHGFECNYLAWIGFENEKFFNAIIMHREPKHIDVDDDRMIESMM